MGVDTKNSINARPAQINRQSDITDKYAQHWFLNVVARPIAWSYLCTDKACGSLHRVFLLTNPWKQFTSVSTRSLARQIRFFDRQEAGKLDLLPRPSRYRCLNAQAKTCTWSFCRS